MPRSSCAAFGEKVFDAIEAEPQHLREVDGVGPVRAARIAAAGAEQRVVLEIMVFLHNHGVGRHGGTHLQDLRRRRRPSHDRKPVPAGVR